MPCVPMITMLYTTIAATSHHEKCLKRKKKKKGNMQLTINQLMSDIQFFFVLKILILENASDQSCLVEGIIKFPFTSFQPYEGTWRRLSINAIIKFKSVKQKCRLWSSLKLQHLTYVDKVSLLMKRIY